MSARLDGGGSWVIERILREPTSDRGRIAAVLQAKMEASPPTHAIDTLTLEFTEFGGSSTQTLLFDRATEESRATGHLDFHNSEVPDALRDAVNELKLRIGHSPLYRVIEVDPWSRIPERRNALLNLDP
jgi:DNA polymerase-4/protein ImuB